MQYIDFEKPLAELERKIEELSALNGNGGVDLNDEVNRLKKKAKKLRQDIFSKLTPWQTTLLARHPMRPYTLDYIEEIAEDFIELHGDRKFGEDPSIVGGFGKLSGENGGQSVLLLGHQKGRSTKEKILRNFAMPRPEGYRKALRLMKLAERFGKPIITLIDTPGAYPGVDAEERGQAVAIAESIMEMSGLRVPIISVVIGEGGSGGALAIGVADRILMLEYSIYSVISPEGCASILWRNSEKNEIAAEAMKLTSRDLMEFGIIDEIIKEPPGAAHRDPTQIAHRVSRAIIRHLGELEEIDPDELLRQRHEKYRKIGELEEAK